MASSGKETVFLRDKWIKTFYFFDVNKDGKVTREDISQLADNLSKSTDASEEETKKTREEWMKWFRNRPNVLCVDQFVAIISEMFRDVDEFTRQNRGTAIDLFDRIDLNKDGIISLDEFELFYKACGYNDRNLAQTNFSKIDKDKDGYIQKDEFVDDFVRHNTDPDPVSGQAYLFSVPTVTY